MLCEACGSRTATQALTKVVDGQKRVLYRCDECAVEGPGSGTPKPERPCEQCGKREGRIKLTRLGDKLRTVSYLCEVCAGVS